MEVNGKTVRRSKREKASGSLLKQGCRTRMVVRVGMSRRVVFPRFEPRHSRSVCGSRKGYGPPLVCICVCKQQLCTCVSFIRYTFFFSFFLCVAGSLICVCGILPRLLFGLLHDYTDAAKRCVYTRIHEMDSVHGYAWHDYTIKSRIPRFLLWCGGIKGRSGGDAEPSRTKPDPKDQ